MFWEGKVPLLIQLEAYLNNRDIAFATQLSLPTSPVSHRIAKCDILIASLDDAKGISRLLNENFDKNKVKTATTPEWIASTFTENKAIWIVAKDSGGTVRACISSFEVVAPYPNTLSKCGELSPWGIVDWFCVHPLWRNKGVASRLLNLLDYITYRIGRKAHVFLKEGYPLPFPHIPVYSTTLKCRRAGSDTVTHMREGTGLDVYDYRCLERSSDLPMIRIEGLRDNKGLDDWEKALDTELPPCWVFVNGSSSVDSRKGWKPDSLVSMYAFRWIPGRWFGKRPHQDIL
jgi:GNAT superfamily N-acetyltransferase